MLCWWPYAIVLMVGVENKRILDDLILLPYLNSLINPCLYMIINRDVRASVKKFFGSNIRNEEMEMESTTMSRMKRIFSKKQYYSPKIIQTEALSVTT